MNTKYIFLFLLSMLSMISFSFATCSVSGASASSVSTATTGSTVSVTTSYTGTDCTGESLYLDYDSGLSVTDPASGFYSGVPSETLKIFTITSSNSGVYNYNSRVSSTSSTSQSIEFVDPSVLIISMTPVTKSSSSGSTFALTVTLSNTKSSAAVSTSYALSYSGSYFSISGDSTSGSVTIPASSSTQLSYTVSVNCFSGSKTIYFGVGDESEASSVVITSSNCPSSSSDDDDSSSTTQQSVVTDNNGVVTPSESPTITDNTSNVDEGSQVNNASSVEVVPSLIFPEQTAMWKNIKIVLNDQDGNPLANERVEIVSPSGGSVFEYTDSNGTILYKPSESGEYTISIEKYGISKTFLSQSVEKSGENKESVVGGEDKTTTPKQPVDYSWIIYSLFVVVILIIIYKLLKGKRKKKYKGFHN